MKFILLLWGFFLTFSGLTYGQLNTRNDSAHSIILDGVITNGILITPSHRSRHANEIREQLKFMVGQLNAINGGPQLTQMQISINGQEYIARGLRRVTYAARMLIAWDRNRPVPASLQLILPSQGHASSLSRFYQSFSQNCNDNARTPITFDNYWYHYRPASDTCSLRNAQQDDINLVARTSLQLSVSNTNTTGRSPEYHKIWEDGQLVATIVVAKDHPGSTSHDEGIDGFNQIYRELLQLYGRPQTINESFSGDPAPQHSSLLMTFHAPQGTINVNLELVEGLRQLNSSFISRFNERTLTSDYIAYFGHAGLGANVRVLSRLGRFRAGQYQIYLINGCDTFSYLDLSLARAHAAANPGYPDTKFLDVITNAMPGYFHSFSRNNTAMMRALTEQRITYRQILQGFDPVQRALVSGEEDNNWPYPFELSIQQ